MRKEKQFARKLARQNKAARRAFETGQKAVPRVKKALRHKA